MGVRRGHPVGVQGAVKQRRGLLQLLVGALAPAPYLRQPGGGLLLGRERLRPHHGRTGGGHGLGLGLLERAPAAAAHQAALRRPERAEHEHGVELLALG